MSHATAALVALVLAACAPTTMVGPGPAVGGQPRSGAIDGVALGLDGRPTAGITVRAVDATGAMLTEGVTAADGRFALRVDQPAHGLVARCEAVRLDVALPPFGEPLHLSFAHAEHFTLGGTLLDPSGTASGLVDIALRDARHKVLAIATTDVDGNFTVRANATIHELVVDPLGWAHVVPGPFAADAALALDLRKDRAAFVRLRGRTLDAAGQATSGVHVVAYGSEGAVARTTSGPDGAFTLWSTRPVTRLVGLDGPPVAARSGPWPVDAQVDLDERAHGYVVVRGHIVGPHGARTAIYGATARPKAPHRVKPDGTAGKRGEFAVRVARDQTHLWFFQEGGNREAYVPIVPGQDLVVRFER